MIFFRNDYFDNLLHDDERIAIICMKSEKLLIGLVSTDGNLIRHIDNPSENVQMAAVKNNGLAIKWIEHSTFDVQVTSILQNSRARDYFIQEHLDKMDSFIKEKYK